MDKDNVIIEANPSAIKILGTNLSMGSNIKGVLSAYPKEMIDLLNQEFSFSEKEILLSNLSPIRWVGVTLRQINKEGITSQNGKLLVLHDIDRRKQFEKTLFESQVNLSVVIENTEDIITYIDTEQKLLLFNKAYREMMQKLYNVEVKIGMSSLDFLPQDDKIWWTNNNQRGLNGDRFTVEFQKQIGDETRYFETSFNPIIIAEKLTGVSDFTRDVTERRLVDKQLEDKVKEMERINKIMIDREMKMIELKQEIKDNTYSNNESNKNPEINS